MSQPGTRVEGVDVARGLASLLMIQGHAFHGWVAPESRDGAYALTRTLGTLPLPAFLVLAGAAVTWRLQAGKDRGQSTQVLRRALARRGLQVLLYGYLVSLGYAALDGGLSWPTVLRADVLHVIGLSIATGALCVGRTLDPAPFARRCLALGLLATALCPLLAGLAPPPALAPVAALFVDAPPYTRMPWVPLFAWFAAGTGGAALMLTLRDESAMARRAGTSKPGLVSLGILSASLVAIGTWTTHALEHAFPGPLARTHPAIWGNVADLGGRGLLVLTIGGWLSLVLPSGLRRPLTRLGRGSLVAYVVHVPFCYGTLGAPLRHATTMGEATLALGLLVALSWGSVYAWDAIKMRIRHPRTTTA